MSPEKQARRMALIDHQFLFVIGKGGVGKTTVSAALGLAAARAGKKTLIALTNSKERLSGLLGSAPLTENIQNIAPNLDAVNMNADAALEEYGLMILKVKAVSDRVFGNRYIKNFLHGTPGFDAWTMLGKAYYHATTNDPRARYDLVILDAPATGHGLDMLRVPDVIARVAPPGLLRREAESALRLFQDPTRAGCIVVTLAEDMPTNETIELHRALTHELHIPVPSLVANQIVEPLFSVQDTEFLESSWKAIQANEDMTGVARSVRRRVEREATQLESLAKLRTLGVELVLLPRLDGAPFGRRQVETLGTYLDAEQSSAK